MTDILITGFGPFPGAPSNPSAQLVGRLRNMRGPLQIGTHVFDTSYAAVDRDLPKLLARHRPRILLMFGLAGRTRFLRIETLARNRQSLLHPDGTGFTPATDTIRTRASPFRRGRAPFVRLQRAARAAGVDTRLSRNAGNYVCNYVYWRALELAAKAESPDIVVFVHVPKLRSRARRSTQELLPTLAQLVRAARGIIVAANSGLDRN